MANKDLVSEEVLQELTNKIQEIVNNYCWNLEHFTDSEVDDFFQASADEVTFYNGLINDNIESKNFLWSSKKIAEELAKAIIEANGYTDNMIKNISSIKLSYVTSLPTSDISENTIYILKASDGTSKDTLNLYNATDGWISIGEFDISLDDYYTKTEIDTKMDLKANKTEVVANDKIVQTLDASTNSADTVLSTNGLQVEMDKKANDNEVIKKTSLVTSIDSSSTEDTIPSSKTIYEKTKNMCTTTVTDVPATDVVFTDSNVSKSGSYEICKYCVKNGVCYVTLNGLTFDSNYVSDTTFANLPKPVFRQDFALTNSYGDVSLGKLFLEPSGTIHLYTRVTPVPDSGFISFSYPVAEQ